MRLILKSLKNYSTYIKRFNFKRNLSNASVTVQPEKTLTGRILVYLNSDDNKPEKTPKITLNQFNNFSREQLHNLETSDLINSLQTLKEPARNLNFHKIFNTLDTECCLRLNEFDTKNIFKLLNIYLSIVKGHITEYKFYEMAMEKLFNNLEKLSKIHLLQFMFYVSLQKNKTIKTKIILRKCLETMNEEFIKSLTLEELCIICNSTFKTSTRITQTILLETVRNCLNENLFLLKDPEVFVTFIKIIRQCRFQDDNLLATISCAICFNKTLNYYAFTTLCHILALYADYKYYDGVLLEIFKNRSIELLKNSNYTSKTDSLLVVPRTKDIKRFLWSLANLNYANKIDRSELSRVIVPEILCRMKTGEFKDDPESLIEIILYLWMLNYQALELVPYALTDFNIQTIRNRKSSPTKDRLNLLLQLIYFENKTLFNQLNLKPPAGKSKHIDLNYQLKQRPTLARVYETLKSLTRQMEINKFELTYEVPYLNIAGITGYRKKIYKAVYIEVLDDYTCMKNSDGLATGLMALKLRVLERFEEALIVISQEETETLYESELKDYLLDEIDLVASLK